MITVHEPDRDHDGENENASCHVIFTVTVVHFSPTRVVRLFCLNLDELELPSKHSINVFCGMLRSHEARGVAACSHRSVPQRYTMKTVKAAARPPTFDFSKFEVKVA